MALQRDPITGRLRRDKATGRIRKSSAANSRCCCVGRCSCRADGSGAYNNMLLVNISGFSLPTNCFLGSMNALLLPGLWSPPFPITYKFVTLNLNGTRCLTQIPGSCTWFVDLPCLVRFWINEPCGGYSLSGSTFDVTTIRLSVLASNGLIYSVQTRFLGVPVNYFFTQGNGGQVLDPFTFTSSATLLPCGGSVTVPNQAYYCALPYQVLGADYFTGLAITPQGFFNSTIIAACLAPGTIVPGTMLITDQTCS